jgi:hypothetical protein
MAEINKERKRQLFLSRLLSGDAIQAITDELVALKFDEGFVRLPNNIDGEICFKLPYILSREIQRNRKLLPKNVLYDSAVTRDIARRVPSLTNARDAVIDGIKIRSNTKNRTDDILLKYRQNDSVINNGERINLWHALAGNLGINHTELHWQEERPLTMFCSTRFGNQAAAQFFENYIASQLPLEVTLNPMIYLDRAETP